MQIIRENQRVNQLLLDETINLTPPSPTSYFTDNFLQRTLARLFGLTTSNKLVQLAATESGALLVSNTGAGYSFCEQINENTSDNLTTYDFSQVVNSPDIYCATNPILIAVSPDGSNFSSLIELPTDMVWSPPISVKAIQIKSFSAGLSGTVYAMGYY